MTLDEINDALGVRYPISEKQLAFCRAFLQHGIGMRAVREAGFNHSTPGAQSSAAYRLLKQKKIQDCLNLLKGEVVG